MPKIELIRFSNADYMPGHAILVTLARVLAARVASACSSIVFSFHSIDGTFFSSFVWLY